MIWAFSRSVFANSLSFPVNRTDQSGEQNKAGQPTQPQKETTILPNAGFIDTKDFDFDQTEMKYDSTGMVIIFHLFVHLLQLQLQLQKPLLIEFMVFSFSSTGVQVICLTLLFLLAITYWQAKRKASKYFWWSCSPFN